MSFATINVTALGPHLAHLCAASEQVICLQEHSVALEDLGVTRSMASKQDATLVVSPPAPGALKA
eukprot:13639830-Alexandrium_andersonii.AAC.1